MKWIGQNIYDNLALFRGNVRIGGGNVYGGDGSSNNWLMIDCQDGNDTSGGGITFHEATLSGSVDFDTPQYGAKIVYNEDDDEFSIGTIENSTFKKQIKMDRNSTTVDFAGNITVAGSNNTFSSATSLKPVIKIKNTTNDANASSLNFIKDKGAAGADGDDIGTILWTGDNSAQEQTNFASIIAEVSEADDTDEAGKLTFNVAASDGTTSGLAAGLVLEGEHNANSEVDVTIGNRTGSTTTIAGNLTINGTTLSFDSSIGRRVCFELSGYVSADGSNFFYSNIMSGNKAPFLHDVNIGSDGLTADNPAAFLRANGTVMPYAGALKMWKGWGASAGSATIDVTVFKYTPTADDATNASLVLVKNTNFTGAVIQLTGTSGLGAADRPGNLQFRASDSSLLFSAEL